MTSGVSHDPTVFKDNSYSMGAVHYAIYNNERARAVGPRVEVVDNAHTITNLANYFKIFIQGSLAIVSLHVIEWVYETDF